MNILIPDSWLRQYLETEATPFQIKDYLSLCGPSVERVNRVGNDYVYEIEITTNRIDTASVFGIAHEAAAILPRFNLKASLKELELASDLALQTTELPLTVEDPQHLCDRLLAIVLTNPQNGISRASIRERLERSGIRALDNIIDITNYVMLEVGHPTHVFDYDRIKTGKLILRKARANEKLVTLDGKEFALNQDDVVIDDSTGRIIDLPGIMGTQNSVVTSETKRLVFFIESNDPVNIRRTSLRFGLRTMAATINEKHPDPHLAKTAMLRGIKLYQELTGAKIAGRLIDIFPHPPNAKTIITSAGFINSRLGIDLTANEITSILKSLSFKVDESDNRLTITPPSFRQFDVTIPEDIVEEVARLYGYYHLPSQLMTGKIPVPPKPKDLPLEAKSKIMLKFWGFTETYHYSFISKDLIAKAGLDTGSHLRLVNPLTADIEYMRLSLIPSLLETAEKNQHISSHLSLFELSNVYLPQKNNLPNEESRFALVSQNGFFRLKGIVTHFLQEMGISDYDEREEPNWQFGHPGQTLALVKNNQVLAYLGLLHPKLSQKFNLKTDLFLADIDFGEIVKYHQPIKQYQPLPLFPAIIEDHTIPLHPPAKAGEVIKTISQTDKLVRKVELIDRYKENITLRITYQDPNKNLESKDIKALREKILTGLNKKFGLNLG